MTHIDFPAIIRTQIKEAGGVRALARKWEVSHTYVVQMRDGVLAPNDHVLAQLGYCWKIVKVKRAA